MLKASHMAIHDALGPASEAAAAAAFAAPLSIAGSTAAAAAATTAAVVVGANAVVASNADFLASVAAAAAAKVAEVPDLPVKVDVRAQGSSFLIVVRPVTADNPLMYRVKNETSHHMLYYRQVDCEEYDWQELGPGLETGYTWEEPLRRQRLLLRVRDTSARVRGKVGDYSHHHQSGDAVRKGKRRKWMTATSERSTQIIKEVDLNEPSLKLKGAKLDFLPTAAGLSAAAAAAGARKGAATHSGGKDGSSSTAAAVGAAAAAAAAAAAELQSTTDGAQLTLAVRARGPTKVLAVTGASYFGSEGNLLDDTSSGGRSGFNVLAGGGGGIGSGSAIDRKR
jgi:hypothetical protein